LSKPDPRRLSTAESIAVKIILLMLVLFVLGVIFNSH
jgi:hypothetical protein